MNEHEKSDGLVVPAKLPNKTGVPVAEAVEGSSPAEGNTDGQTRPGLSAGQGVASGLEPCASSSKKGQGHTVHGTAAPRRPLPPAGGLCGHQPEGHPGGGQGDVGDLRAGLEDKPREPAL